ncbi:MAG: hypothetical protein K8963_09645, partial [Proteobacteria bacterium]|nr:hypothetical protein [Pseudomonadota bacterium]
MTESNTFKHLPESDRRTLAAMGDVETVDLLTFDVNGQRRGKRIAIWQIDKIYRDGFFMPYSVYALDIGGGTVDSTGYGLASGDRDALCRPVPGSLRPVPWLERPGAQVLFEMYGVDGRPFTGNPRAMLAQVVGKLASAGLHPVAALEYEFYLLDKPATDSHQVRLPLNSRTGARAANTEVYSLDELDNQRKFISDACRYARTLGINAESVIAEYAPGQFEINLTHSKDIVAMCDQMIMLKQAIKSAALDNNMCATFMAKPYPDLSGSGAHIHLSINDTTGHNVFSSGTAQPNKHELASTAAQPNKHELASTAAQPNKHELASTAAQPAKHELAAATQPNKDELAASAAQPNKYEL